MNQIRLKMSEEIIDIYTKDSVKIGDNIIVELNNVLFYGITKSIENIKEKKKINSLYKYVRLANSKDKKIIKKNHIDSQKAFIKCRKLIETYKLPMKLVNVSFSFDRKQLIFKFISDDRIDFRNLAKELARIYKTRIELRQIGVRDKAKEIGGCGQCGQQLCCTRMLNNFNSVSINMAKNQNIALNPNKINGVCGRLLCCLKYEDECYKECRKELPKIGKEIITAKGKGKVVFVDPLSKKYNILTEDKDIVECDVNDSVK